MRFSYHKVITVLAIGSGFVLMFNGTAGVEVFLYLCGVTIVATVVIPNRRVDIGVQLRGFKLRLRSLPASQETDAPRLDRRSSPDEPTSMQQENDKDDQV